MDDRRHDVKSGMSRKIERKLNYEYVNQTTRLEHD